ncbi:hypothetical protein CPLU01_00879 [Colletotrichum plurivorum]|uniref:Uncharacterized protein n=1 Tax=Colletotrichum plurivorum TaxID=2175906 RepID=A0A8H6U4X3_9PEZI|nr:hypothetical protein CPLU01_00879 [Colletotrichum plurivorum]
MDPRPAVAASQTRSPIRHRGLVLAATAVTAIVFGIRYQAASMRTNELNQRTRAPYHVTVDRSGGGI